jgi:hypothetical protein
MRRRSALIQSWRSDVRRSRASPRNRIWPFIRRIRNTSSQPSGPPLTSDNPDQRRRCVSFVSTNGGTSCSRHDFNVASCYDAQVAIHSQRCPKDNHQMRRVFAYPIERPRTRLTTRNEGRAPRQEWPASSPNLHQYSHMRCSVPFSLVCQKTPDRRSPCGTSPRRQ